MTISFFNIWLTVSAVSSDDVTPNSKSVVTVALSIPTFKSALDISLSAINGIAFSMSNLNPPLVMQSWHACFTCSGYFAGSLRNPTVVYFAYFHVSNALKYKGLLTSAISNVT